MSKVTTPIEQDGYNAYGYVDGKRVPVLSTSMGNCWDQDDQRAFCGHIVHCVNNYERLAEMVAELDELVCYYHGCFPLDRATEKQRRLNDTMVKARALLSELENQQ